MLGCGDAMQGFQPLDSCDGCGFGEILALGVHFRGVLMLRGMVAWVRFREETGGC